MHDDGRYLIAVAIIGFIGQTIAVIIAAYLNQRGIRLAQQAASDASLNASKAQIATANAARDAANAARQLVEAAKINDKQNSQLQATLSSVKETGDVTHTIVNSQRTAMEERIEAMQRTINNLASRLDK